MSIAILNSCLFNNPCIWRISCMNKTSIICKTSFLAVGGIRSCRQSYKLYHFFCYTHTDQSLEEALAKCEAVLDSCQSMDDITWESRMETRKENWEASSSAIFEAILHSQNPSAELCDICHKAPCLLRCDECGGWRMCPTWVVFHAENYSAFNSFIHWETEKDAFLQFCRLLAKNSCAKVENLRQNPATNSWKFGSSVALNKCLAVGAWVLQQCWPYMLFHFLRFFWRENPSKNFLHLLAVQCRIANFDFLSRLWGLRSRTSLSFRKFSPFTVVFWLAKFSSSLSLSEWSLGAKTGS